MIATGEQTIKEHMRIHNDGQSETSQEDYKSEDSDSFPFRICFICDQFHLADKIFSSEECEHTFCRK